MSATPTDPEQDGASSKTTLVDTGEKHSIELHLPPVTIAGDTNPATPSFPIEQSISPAVHATITRMQSGPIPPATDFGEYERVFPGAGKWLLDQAALDAAHTRDMDRAGLKLAKRQTTLQHVVPAVTVSVALATAGLIAIFANPGAGAIVFAATIGSILTAYLTGKPWRREQEESSGHEDESDSEETSA